MSKWVFDHLELPGHHPVHHHGSSVHWSIIPVKPPVPSCHLQPLLLENLQEFSSGIHNIVSVHHGPPGHVVGVDETLTVKEGQTICFILDTWTLALIGPGVPFPTHCLECCLVWRVWMDTEDSFMVTIKSSIAMECWQISAMKGSQIPTLLFFISWVRSLGTHQANIFER